MSYRKIQGALDTHLQDFAGTDLVFPSTPYKSGKGQAFLAAHFLPGRARTVLLGPDMPTEHRGLYQIDVQEVSVQAGLARIDALREHFSSGRLLTFEMLEVTLGLSEVGPNRGNLKHTKMPLSIRWRAYF